MKTKNYPQSEEQSSQPSASQQPDMNQVLATLSQVFTTFQNQLQNRPQDEAPKPFEGAAKRAVEVFNDIVIGLQLRFLPIAPNFEAKAVSSTEIELTWTDNTNNADGFKIKRCQGQNCQNFTEIKQLASAIRVYRDLNLSNSTTYRYQLATFNARGEKLTNIVEAITPATTQNS
jgi:hypothetical protein